MILDTIKKAIRKSGKSRYQIAKDLTKSGKSLGKIQSQLYKIIQGKDLHCKTADKLLKYFGYTIAKKTAEKAKSKRVKK